MSESARPATTISSITVTAMPLPLIKPMSSGLGTYRWVDCTAVEVRVDGPTGHGYTFGVGGAASAALVPYISQELAPLIIGRDALAVESIWDAMFAPNKARMRWPRPVGFVGARHRLLGHPGQVGRAAAVDAARQFSPQCPCTAAAVGCRCRTMSWSRMRPLRQPRNRRLQAQDRWCQGSPAAGPAAASKWAMTWSCSSTPIRSTTRARRWRLLRMLAEFGVAWMEEPVVADSPDDLAEVASGSGADRGGREHVLPVGVPRPVRATRFATCSLTSCGAAASPSSARSAHSPTPSAST